MKIHLTGDEIGTAVAQYVLREHGVKLPAAVHTKLVYQSNCLGLRPGTFTAEVNVVAPGDAQQV
jgi:hypothetical protein